jgi:DNA-binding NarL/FixJ family response regulator
MSRSFRIFVAVAVRLYREGLSEILQRVDTFSLVGARTLEGQVIEAIIEAQPDVVLLDMTTFDSWTIARDVHRRCPNVSIVGLGVGESEADTLACAEVGITGFLTPETTVDELVRVVTSAAHGEMICSPKLAGRLVRKLATLSADRQPESPLTRLTAREREIARLLEADLSNKEIAVALGIEVATVKNHVHNVLEKLKVHRRSDIARLLGPVVGRPVTAAANLPHRKHRSTG